MLRHRPHKTRWGGISGALLRIVRLHGTVLGYIQSQVETWRTSPGCYAASFTLQLVAQVIGKVPAAQHHTCGLQTGYVNMRDLW